MTYALIAVASIVAILIWLRWWMSQPTRVFGEIDALDLPDDTKRAIRADCEAARRADRRTWPYDLSAPLVTLVALLFTPRSADRLPAWASKWDNDVSLNGDGHGWLDAEGQWHHGRDGVEPPAGTERISYDDPRYGGDAYYAEGHHPRSFYARWVWVGLRNRASKLSKDLGVRVEGQPEVISGSMDIGRRQEGHFVLKYGDAYHYKCFKRLGPFVLIRSYGHKLEIPYRLQRPGGAAATAIGRSLKRWKG